MSIEQMEEEAADRAMATLDPEDIVESFVRYVAEYADHDDYCGYYCGCQETFQRVARRILKENG